MDCFLRQKLPETVFKTDFYGSPWNWDFTGCGGGGLSVRRVAKCIEACQVEPDPEISLPEDCWLIYRLKKIGFE